MKKNYLLAKGAFLLLMGLQMNSAHAQQKIGGAVGASDASALLHLGDLNPAVKKGLLMPRVQLSATNVWGLAGATPVEGMHVYNTATAGTGATAVTAGEYYWDGNGWVQLITSVASQSITGNGTPVGQSGLNPVKGMIYTDVDDVTPSPTLGQQWTYDGTTWISYNAPSATEWYLAGGTSDAGGNKKSSIYRTGKIGIGTSSPKATLDVWGDALINGLTVGRGSGNNGSNSVLGTQALNSLTSGVNNTAVGLKALFKQTTGSNNVALGYLALQNVDGGSANTSVGYAAMSGLISGGLNTAVGNATLLKLTSGDNNIAIGVNAGLNQTSGSGNIVIGRSSDLPVLTGSNQMNIGNLIYGTGVNGAVGAGNLGIGTTTPGAKLDVNGDALINGLTVGRGAGNSISNSGVGLNVLNSLSSGVNNTAMGWNALTGLQTGNNNVGIGFNALAGISSTSGNTAVGYVAGQGMSGSSNSVFGNIALYKLGAGDNNVAVGQGAGSNQTAGNSNILIGSGTQVPNLTGSYQMSIGNLIYGTGVTGAVGAGNLGIGTTTPGAKLDVNGDALVNSLTVGRGAGNDQSNSVLGSNAFGNNTTGLFNTATGASSLSANTTGSNNTASGGGAMLGNTSGGDNTAIGTSALRSNVTGGGNTAIGSSALYNCNPANSIIAIGANAGYNQTSGVNNIIIGNGANVPNLSGSNQIRMGNAGITYAGIQVPWTITSDVRLKTNIINSPLGLEFIKELRPVVYNRYINNNTSFDTKNEYGFIAQDVKDLLDKRGITSQSGLLSYDKQADRYSIRYNDFIPILTKALQEETSKTESLQAQMESMKKDYQAQINELKAAVEALKNK